MGQCENGLALGRDEGEAGSGKAAETQPKFPFPVPAGGSRGCPRGLSAPRWFSHSAVTGLRHVTDISALAPHIIFKSLVFNQTAQVLTAQDSRICSSL